tara:strand:+ start:142 stop:327 length:186 start_codon:yes stop_codon:yes gene_type:complete
MNTLDGDKLLTRIEEIRAATLHAYDKENNVSASDYHFYKAIILNEISGLIKSGDYKIEDGL